METQMGGNGVNGTSEKEKQVMVAKKTRVKNAELFLRFLSFALTLAAAIILGLDKQTKIVALSLVPTLPPLDVPVTAKWHYLSTFVYFVVANAIACTYAAISFTLLLANKGTNKTISLLIVILDHMMVALLFSCGGAAMAVGLLGQKGNSHVQWNKVCNTFGKFCNQVAIAVLISLLGSLLFILMVLLPTLKLHTKKI